MQKLFSNVHVVLSNVQGVEAVWVDEHRYFSKWWRDLKPNPLSLFFNNRLRNSSHFELLALRNCVQDALITELMV